jgi:hypothetical protein
MAVAALQVDWQYTHVLRLITIMIAQSTKQAYNQSISSISPGMTARWVLVTGSYPVICIGPNPCIFPKALDRCSRYE